MMQRTRDLCKLFHRDERGQAMVITAIMALLLFRSVMASYDTGVAVSARIRGQNVADAAAYSGAIWQARFLNYCAYTRRAILANYAQIALMNANIVNKKCLDNIYDCNDLWITAYTDESIVKDSLDILGWARDLMVPTEGDHGDIETGKFWPNFCDGQQVAEHSNVILAESQEALHAILSPIEGVMGRIIEDACIFPDEIKQAGISHAFGSPGILNSGMLGSLFSAVPLTAALNANLLGGALGFPDLPILNIFPKGLVHRKKDGNDNTKVKIDEITPAFERGHTKIGMPQHWGLQIFQGRPFFAVGDPFTRNPDYLKIMFVTTFPLPVIADGDTELTESGGKGKMKTGEHGFYGFPGMLGMYLWFYLRIDTPFGPIIIVIATPILGNGEEQTTNFKHEFAHVYEVRPDIYNSTDYHLLEPSVYAAVAVNEQKIPYFRPNSAHPDRHLRLLNESKDLVCLSRAKVYFQPPEANEANRQGSYPDLMFPFFGAKLATIKEGGKKEGSIIGNGDLMIEVSRDPTDFLFGVPIAEEAVFRFLGWGSVNY